MKIYTRSGDKGTTGLFGGRRAEKNDPRIAAYGTIDELNATLGTAQAESLPADMAKIVVLLQNQLFQLGAELASPEPDQSSTAVLTEGDVVVLEEAIDRLEKDLPPLKAFILPGGTKGAAHLHVARCVCRRAERELVTLAEQTEVRATIMKYVNRLSDLLFVLARSVNKSADVAETVWVQPK